ncbi:acyloxyacyl hydrolase [Pseudorhodoferax soli]|uniref:Lipid A 3-O-deacylase n=1 Tax=Pseudorhodoferax soli TaxID=545864 RepID=A0A368XL48_9BURK|nr:acyloxyacyl hydrolase [Pseudorhodoferax soli]RCW66754.1 lipid A 3-O-deacylase [Pseudorhodoferax soli]
MKPITKKAALAALCLVFGAAAQAQQQRQGPALYLEAGQARHHGATTDAMTLGVRLPTDVRFFSGRLALAVDGYASRWQADALPGERDDFTQLGLVPMLRWRFDEGRSPWFVEGGIGVSYLVHGYRTRTKAFGSRWNFSDHLGVGYSFGRHEIGMYVKHVSNGGLDKPNPGETFYQLRYSYAL